MMLCSRIRIETTEPPEREIMTNRINIIKINKLLCVICGFFNTTYKYLEE